MCNKLIEFIIRLRRRPLHVYAIRGLRDLLKLIPLFFLPHINYIRDGTILFATKLYNLFIIHLFTLCLFIYFDCLIRLIGVNLSTLALSWNISTLLNIKSSCKFDRDCSVFVSVFTALMAMKYSTMPGDFARYNNTRMKRPIKTRRS